MWFAAWEETTELLFVISVGFTLWVFRDGLFGGTPHRPHPAQGELDPAKSAQQSTRIEARYARCEEKYGSHPVQTLKARLMLAASA